MELVISAEDAGITAFMQFVARTEWTIGSEVHLHRPRFVLLKQAIMVLLRQYGLNDHAHTLMLAERQLLVRPWTPPA